MTAKHCGIPRLFFNVQQCAKKINLCLIPYIQPPIQTQLYLDPETEKTGDKRHDDVAKAFQVGSSYAII